MKKVACKVKDINSLTYLKIYDVINDSQGGYLITDDFENKQYYYYDNFISLEELRDLKLNEILKR